MIMELARAQARFDAEDPAAARVLVDQAHGQAMAALAELRDLVRGVHPPVLSDRGLDAALSGLAALCPVPVTVDVDLAARPAPAVEAIAYFVVAESPHQRRQARPRHPGPGRTCAATTAPCHRHRPATTGSGTPIRPAPGWPGSPPASPPSTAG